MQRLLAGDVDDNVKPIITECATCVFYFTIDKITKKHNSTTAGLIKICWCRLLYFLGRPTIIYNIFLENKAGQRELWDAVFQDRLETPTWGVTTQQ